MKQELTPNLEAELKRMVDELRAISAVLDATEIPPLVRPDVPYKQVTEELAHWAIRVYAYSILSQFREMLCSALHLYDADHVPAVFLCARAMWEMAAHSYYVKKHCSQHMDKKDWQATWDFMWRINQGSRHMKEKQKKAAAVGAANAAATVVQLPEGPHISKVMACFNEVFGSGSTEAADNYIFLSEFCHPSSFAFTNHLEVEEPKAGPAARR